METAHGLQGFSSREQTAALNVTFLHKRCGRAPLVKRRQHDGDESSSDDEEEEGSRLQSVQASLRLRCLDKRRRLKTSCRDKYLHHDNN
ncbi:uncharacterized protein V6R79_024393 [Siganus canaliculatus]